MALGKKIYTIIVVVLFVLWVVNLWNITIDIPDSDIPQQYIDNPLESAGTFRVGVLIVGSILGVWIVFVVTSPILLLVSDLDENEIWQD